MTSKAWKMKVKRLIKERTGCTWEDLCGDEEILDKSYQDDDTPEEFVEWYCEKYDLDDVRTTVWGMPT